MVQAIASVGTNGTGDSERGTNGTGDSERGDEWYRR